MANFIPRQIERNLLHQYPGRRRGSMVWICEDYEYSLDHRHNPIWRCKFRGRFGESCPGKLELNEDNQLWLMTDHVAYHRPDPILRQEWEMRRGILHMAREQLELSAQQIWEYNAHR